MIVTDAVETLTTFGVKDNVTLDSIIAKSREMDKNWNNHVVENTEAVSYGVSFANNDLKLAINQGSKLSAFDMTDYAFSQLCQRVIIKHSGDSLTA